MIGLRFTVSALEVALLLIKTGCVKQRLFTILMRNTPCKADSVGRFTARLLFVTNYSELTFIQNCSAAFRSPFINFSALNIDSWIDLKWYRFRYYRELSRSAQPNRPGFGFTQNQNLLGSQLADIQSAELILTDFYVSVSGESMLFRIESCKQTKQKWDKGQTFEVLWSRQSATDHLFKFNPVSIPVKSGRSKLLAAPERNPDLGQVAFRLRCVLLLLSLSLSPLCIFCVSECVPLVYYCPSVCIPPTGEGGKARQTNSLHTSPSRL